MNGKVDRRIFLASLASTSALAACSGSSALLTPANSSGPGASSGALGRKLAVPSIPMEIVNESGRSDTMYFYLTATTDPVQPQNKTYHLTDTEGHLALCEPTDGKEVSYSIPLPKDKTTIALPRLQGIRIYVSFGKELYVTVGPNGIPSATAGWLKGNTNYETLFDWVELDYAVDKSDPNGEEVLGGNSTQVDQFGLAFTMSMTGKLPSGQTGTVEDGLGVPGARNKILEALRNTPIFKESVVGNLRAIAPSIGIGVGIFPKDYYDDYIDKVWELYKKDSLIGEAEGEIYTGKVNADDMLEFVGSKQRQSFSFAKPTTEAVFRASPPLESKGGAQGVICAALVAAFNRSTLLVSNNLAACDPKDYYQNAITNHYSKVMHEFGAGGTAYGFGFDDVCSKSSFISVRVPTKASLRVLSFS